MAGSRSNFPKSSRHAPPCRSQCRESLFSTQQKGPTRPLTRPTSPRRGEVNSIIRRPLLIQERQQRLDRRRERKPWKCRFFLSPLLSPYSLWGSRTNNCDRVPIELDHPTDPQATTVNSRHRAGRRGRAAPFSHDTSSACFSISFEIFWEMTSHVASIG